MCWDACTHHSATTGVFVQQLFQDEDACSVLDPLGQGKLPVQLLFMQHDHAGITHINLGMHPYF